MLISDVRRVGHPGPPVDLRLHHGRIVEIGHGLDAEGDEVLAAGGRWVVPGLWDQHVHLNQWARARQRIDLSGSSSPEAVLRIVAAQVATATDPTSMIIGFGFRTGTWDRAATVTELDAVSGDHPVVLISGDVHTGWLSSAAARLLAITPPTGVITEGPWFSIMPRATDLAETTASLAGQIDAALSAASALGVVGLADFEMIDGWDVWPDRMAAGADRVRVRTAVYPDRLDAVLARGLRTGDPLGPSGLVTMGPLKIISDGSLNTRTAFCDAPYVDDPDHARGQPNYSPDQLEELLGTGHRHGLQIALHAIGDAAVDVALDAYARTGARGTVEHAQLVRTEDIARMAGLGITASVQPAHLLDDRDVTHRCWPDRADRCFPLRTMIDRGVRLALGSDAPVSSLDPWLAMAAAVHRSGDEREPWNPAEAITPYEALFASVDGQRVAVGARGDLVLLDHDPLAPSTDSRTAAETLQSVGVAATLVAGRLTYSGT